MIRSNTARTAASMKVVGWLLIAGSLVVQPALAHVPYLEDVDYSPEAAIVGPAEIWAPSDILRAIIYTPVIRAGEELHIECLGCPFVDERVLNDSDGDGVPDPCEEKNCFIATAAFGTETAGKIDTLRSFRDRCLLTDGPGRSFVKFYYEKSPPMAEIVRSRAWLRAAVRILPLPLIGLASLLV